MQQKQQCLFPHKLEAFATVEDRADATAEAWLTHGDPAHMNRRLDDIAAITADDVSRALATRTGASQLHYLPRTQP